MKLLQLLFFIISLGLTIVPYNAFALTTAECETMRKQLLFDLEKLRKERMRVNRNDKEAILRFNEKADEINDKIKEYNKKCTGTNDRN